MCVTHVRTETTGTVDDHQRENAILKKKKGKSILFLLNYIGKSGHNRMLKEENWQLELDIEITNEYYEMAI